MTRNLQESISTYLQYPSPLWESSLAKMLAERGWGRLAAENGIGADTYTTGQLLDPDTSPIIVHKLKILSDHPVVLESASPALRQLAKKESFELLLDDQFDIYLFERLQEAFTFVRRYASQLHETINTLVRSIHILRSPNDDQDLSYSHPEVPFSIFLSVPRKADVKTTAMRVAESVIHETMHLYLTHLEQNVTLVFPSHSTYWSPWKEELREAGGIIHGAFVFRAVRDFYEMAIGGDFPQHFLNSRSHEIDEQLHRAELIGRQLALTENGRLLFNHLVNPK